MKRARPSLQARLLRAVLGAVLLAWVGMSVFTWYEARHELDELLDAHLAQAAALLVAQQAHELDDEVEADAPALHRYAPRVAFQVFHDGRLAMRSANAPRTPMTHGDPGFVEGFRTIAQDGSPWRVFAARRGDGVQVYVGERMAARESILRAVLRGSLSPMLIALPLLALWLWWNVRRGLAPLRAIGDALGRRRGDDWTPLDAGEPPREMRPMVAALNQLFARVEALLASERRFTADAAHELRTPIAALRAQAQVALGAQSEASRRAALEATVRGCDRAAHVVEQLLTLSRLEAGRALECTSVGLGVVARAVLAELAPDAIAKQQSLSLQADDGLQVRGDDTLLAMLLRNLVDNAVRYSPAGAAIEVSIARGGGQVRLSVEDAGPGLPDADIARLGERFFRAAGQDESGSGLGWSIVRRIAAVHDAHVHVRRSARLGGLQVCVDFPAA